MPLDFEPLTDDSRLLLLLADELSPADAESLRKRLAADAALAARLQELQSLQQACDSHLLPAARQPSTAGPSVRSSQRAVSSMLANWQGVRLVSAAGRSTLPRRIAFPLWMYPVAVAAVVTFGLGVWYLALPSGDSLNSLEEDGIALITPGEDGGSDDLAAQDATELDHLFASGVFGVEQESNNAPERELSAIRELREWLQ